MHARRNNMQTGTKNFHNLNNVRKSHQIEGCVYCHILIRRSMCSPLVCDEATTRRKNFHNLNNVRKIHQIKGHGAGTITDTPVNKVPHIDAHQKRYLCAAENRVCLYRTNCATVWIPNTNCSREEYVRNFAALHLTRMMQYSVPAISRSVDFVLIYDPWCPSFVPTPRPMCSSIIRPAKLASGCAVAWSVDGDFTRFKWVIPATCYLTVVTVWRLTRYRTVMTAV